MVRRARVAALLFVAFVAAAGCHGTSQKSTHRAGTPTWNAFCDVATDIERTNQRPGLFADSATILHRLQRQLARLAAATPSVALRADFRTAEPFLFRAYEAGPVAPTGRRLAAVAAVDTALYDHCALGRAIFNVSEAPLFPAPSNG